MALKEVWIGSQGPYLFDDEEKYPNEPTGPNMVGIRTNTIIQTSNIVTDNLTENVRLIVSNSDKEIQEVNDLTQWIKSGYAIEVIDEGDGTVTIRVNHDRVSINDTDSPFDITDQYITIVDASADSVVINLPALANAKQFEHIIKRKDDTAANDVTINADGTEQIEDSGSHSLPNKYDYVVLYPNSDEWLIIGGT